MLRFWWSLIWLIFRDGNLGQLLFQRRQFLLKPGQPGLDALCEFVGEKRVEAQNVTHQGARNLDRLDNFPGNYRPVVNGLDEHRHFAEHVAGAIGLAGAAAFRGNPFACTGDDKIGRRRVRASRNYRLKRTKYAP